MQVKHWFYIMTVLAFASFISFVQIDSAYADSNNLNILFRNLGIALGSLAAIVLAISYQQSKK